MVSGLRLRVVMVRMPAVTPLPSKSHRPDQQRQGKHEKRAAINQKLGYSGPGGNQRPNRILFADAEGAGQKTWNRCHAATSIEMAIWPPVKPIFRRNPYQDRASWLIFIHPVFCRRGMVFFRPARGAVSSDKRPAVVSLPRLSGRLPSSVSVP